MKFNEELFFILFEAIGGLILLGIGLAFIAVDENLFGYIFMAGSLTCALNLYILLRRRRANKPAP